MRIQIIQHVSFEGPAAINTWIKDRGHSRASTRLFQGDPLPAVNSYDFLIVLGGPMGVYDEDKFGWLGAEKKCIEQAIGSGKKVLGICLGAQLIASVLGARVYPNPHKEIGWFPLQFSSICKSIAGFENFPPSCNVFHWHGDTFDLPKSCDHLAQSEACKNQAFIYGDAVIGLQFHLEANEESIRLMLDNGAKELVKGPYIQDRDLILKYLHLVEDNNTRLHNVLSGMEQA